MMKHADCLFEIHTEELPPKAQMKLSEALCQLVSERLQKENIHIGTLKLALQETAKKRETINSIESGELLCSVILKIENIYIESIITKDSAERMKLKKDEQVTILIKASNLSIEEILND